MRGVVFVKCRLPDMEFQNLPLYCLRHGYVVRSSLSRKEEGIVVVAEEKGNDFDSEVKIQRTQASE